MPSKFVRVGEMGEQKRKGTELINIRGGPNTKKREAQKLDLHVAGNQPKVTPQKLTFLPGEFRGPNLGVKLGGGLGEGKRGRGPGANRPLWGG